MRANRVTGGVIAGALVAIVLGVLLLIGSGSWGSVPLGQALTAPVMVLAAVGLASALRGGPSWPVILALAWAGVVGLVIAGLGAVPEPWAGDVGPQPWIDEATALGGPRVAVGALWVAAAIAGLAGVAIRERRAPRPGSSTS